MGSSILTWLGVGAFVYFLVVPLVAMPIWIQQANLPIISDPNYPIKHFSVTSAQQQGVTRTTATGAVTTVATTVGGSVVTFTVAPPPPVTEPPWIGINVNRVTMNAGQPLAGAVYTNRPNAQINVWAGLTSEAKNVVLSGITDGYGRYFGAAVIQVPGIYEIHGELAATATLSNMVVVTVNGVHLSVNPDTVPRGGAVTLDAFYGGAGHTLLVEARPAWNATYTTLGTVVTNQGGHYHGVATVPATFAVGNYVLRVYDPATGQYSNEEWIAVT